MFMLLTPFSPDCHSKAYAGNVTTEDCGTGPSGNQVRKTSTDSSSPYSNDVPYQTHEKRNKISRRKVEGKRKAGPCP